METGRKRTVLLVDGLHYGVRSVRAISADDELLSVGLVSILGRATAGKSTQNAKTYGGNNATGATTQQRTGTGTQSGTYTSTKSLIRTGGICTHRASGNNRTGDNLRHGTNLTGGYARQITIISAGGEQSYTQSQTCYYYSFHCVFVVFLCWELISYWIDCLKKYEQTRKQPYPC